ncbi:MAG: starvation-sensing protein RspA [Christensenellaceae bacterium]|jgi:mannonate dehydratase|nr:starvation-sensing protein RspA [Christensenellaceae bacterium]
MAVTIKDIRAICTAPAKIPLVIVKVETSEPGLYGVGCATFTQRWKTVAHAVEHYMKPLLVGKDVSTIEDHWQMAMVSAYWRNGPILNNAISGVDEALWDIKGKMANMPLYDLLGGKVREGARIYRHADGRTLEEVGDRVQAYIEQGVQVVRVQHGGYGGNHGDAVPLSAQRPENAVHGAYYDPLQYQLSVVKLFDYIRSRFGFDVELCHDVHEHIEPIEAIRLAKELEPHRLFFYEDSLAPEQIEWFEIMRRQTHTPIAMGELFNNPREITPLIAGKLIDFIRCHVSQIGGITPALKLAHFCEAFSVRTAWHGPGDTSPVGHAADIHLDVSSWNFGIQEWSGFNQATLDVFPGCPEQRGGYVYPNAKPGLGIDIDEDLAKKFPCSEELPFWTNSRRPDGSLSRP